MVEPYQFSLERISVPLRKRDIEISVLLRESAGGDEVIVHLHGLGSSKYDFYGSFLSRELARYRLIAFDFPGCGASANKHKIHKSITIDDLVCWTDRILTNLDLNNVTLIGHSMGGLVALLYVTQFPRRVKRLINIEGNISADDCNVFSRNVSKMSWQEFQTQEIIQELSMEFAKSKYTGGRIFAEKLIGQVEPRAFYDYCSSIVEHSKNNDLFNKFTSLKIPRLFVYGDANNALPYLSELSQSSVEVVEIPTAGHWLFYDNPGRFYYEIAKFISGNNVTSNKLENEFHV